ncbi:MAG: C45 family peptidase [Flavobacteriaceae bacterium]|nr:C45 family peptidase [Flavobacteriaceae bacterium]
MIIKIGKYNFLLVLLLLVSCGTKKSIKNEPNKADFFIESIPKNRITDSLFFKGNNSLRKNQYGQWELTASGDPINLGNNIGDLTTELVQQQEEIFFNKIEELVPSKFSQRFLRKFLSWYTRKMYLYMNEEYKQEIFGISQYLSDKYDFIADNYQRSLYLHAAHDIGHAMQDLALVGCSSFAVWGDNTPDGNLVIARNFDFYLGDDFSKEKIITFINPEKGYKFMAVSWAGFVGVMSGMNNEGLTITINAGKSDLPLVAKNPISLVAREIIQYASNIEEAIAIAKEKEVFVSESILVGSAKDNKAVIIEISPEKFGVFEVANASKLICSNHFQSEAYQNDAKNKQHIEESHSKYRYDKMLELLNKAHKITPKIAVGILRNKKGLDNKNLGYGNEKALNQLIAHHGVVFLPHKKMVWVSANPYQMGEFVAFQLDSVFKNSNKKINTLSLPKYLIKKDPFIDSHEFKNYETYKLEKNIIQTAIDNNEKLDVNRLNNFKELNPYSWEVYYLVGLYYYQNKYYQAALNEFEASLLKEISTIPNKEKIENYIKKIKRKLNDS